MQFIISKKDLATALKPIKTIVGKVEFIQLEANKEASTLDIYPLGGRNSMRYSIEAKIKVEGKTIIGSDTLHDFSNVRDNELDLQVEKDTIRMVAGSKFSFQSANPKDVPPVPSFKTDGSFKVKSKQFAQLKDMFKVVDFASIREAIDIKENLEGIPVLVSNDKNGTIIALADAAHCAVYYTKKPIIDEEFKFASYFIYLMEIINSIDTSASFSIGDAKLIIKSPQLCVSIPTLQLETKAVQTINTALTHVFDKKAVRYMTGDVVLTVEDIKSRMKSMRIVSEKKGGEFLEADFTKDNLHLTWTTAKGESQDDIPCKTTIPFKDKKSGVALKIPVKYFSDLVDSSAYTDSINLTIANKKNLYRIDGNKGGVYVSCIAPTV